MNLKRFRQPFRHGAHSVRRTLYEEAMQQMRHGKVPRWVRITHKIYHDYGFKHFCLISVLILYQFFGAAVFYLCEYQNEQTVESEWHTNLKQNRTILIQKIVSSMFNNTDYLFFLTQGQTNQVENKLEMDLKNYENQLGIRFKENTIKWDFWSAMLYAQMICTTIGGGFVRLHPATTNGRLFTMIYALFGVPLVLTVLDDLGKLLTKFLKIPWFWTKCACRRLFRYCTKQTIAEIKKLDEEDKQDLEMFELPIPVALIIVVGWLFLCSATFCIWETEWSYFISFYFFFISLSTIGIGDFAPTQPKYLLILFVYIIIGLSLVSMLVNSIQAKLERTYQTGQNQLFVSGTVDSEIAQHSHEFEALRRNRSSLGVLKGVQSSAYSITREAVQRYFAQKQTYNKSCQTLLSFPSPTRNSMVTRSVHQSRIFPRTLSIDDVMKLVDTEEGDILLLTELTRDQSSLSELSEAIRSDISRDSSMNQLVISKSFDSNFNLPQTVQQQIECSYLPSFFTSSKALPRIQQGNAQRLFNCPSTTPVPLSLEAIEEMEDLLLLRLSLVNEEDGVGESSISTSTTDQTLSSKTREDSQHQLVELDKNANRSHVRRNRTDRTARTGRQGNLARLLASATTSNNNNNNNNNYKRQPTYSKKR